MGQVTPTRFSVTCSEEEIPVNLNTSSSIKKWVGKKQLCLLNLGTAERINQI